MTRIHVPANKILRTFDCKLDLTQSSFVSVKSKSHRDSEMAPPYQLRHFAAQSAKYLNDPTYADFTVVAEEKEYKVSRRLLACHSNWFKALFENKFKV